jgi:serine/threonine-protein kinase RsbT
MRTKNRRIDVRRECDVWLAVGTGARVAQEMGLNKTDRVRIETVVSEMAHNVLMHGEGGSIEIGPVVENKRYGLQICAKDYGPGIPDVSQALEDGYTTKNSLGIGLGVTKRLMDDVAIRSHPGWGTTVTVVQWVSHRCTRRADMDAAIIRTPGSQKPRVVQRKV